MRAVAEVLSQLMHPNRAADIIRMADADPAFAAKLLAAVEADDFGKSLRTLAADAQWGAAPARPAPVRPEAPAPLTTAQRMMANPDIQSQIQANMGGLPPELTQRIQAGDPDAAVEAYQMIAAADGELPMRSTASFDDPESPDYIPDVDMMGFGSGSLAAEGPYRQIELPLGGENELPPRGLIPFGVRGAGVPVGGPTGMGTLVGEPVSAGVPIYPMSNFERALANPARQRWEGFGFPSQYRPGPARIGTTAGTLFDGPAPQRGMIPHPGMGGPRDMIVRQPDRVSMRDLAAAAIAGAAAGGGGYMAGRELGDQLFNEDAVPETQAMGDELPVAPDDTVELTSEGTAELAAETAPPPSVPEPRPAQSWRRVIDEGYVPLGDATPAEIEAANARIRNMVRMGATWDDARTKAYDDMAKGVVARAKQKAEAFLKANPGF